MNQTSNIISIEEARGSRKRFVRSLEHELMTALALQQFTGKEGVRFEGLLSIPLQRRIPGLLADFGLKRIHRMIKLLLQECCYSISLPKYQKLTDTGIAVVACDILLAAEEDQLSMEDLIVFFEMVRLGKFGRFKGMVSHAGMMNKLEQYRRERYAVFVQKKAEIEARWKEEGPKQRSSPEPTPIGDLFGEVTARIVPMKKIS